MKSATYIKNLDPLKIERSYREYPYNLTTLRASKAIEAKLGCPYVAEVGALIAEAYGETLPTNHRERHDFIEGKVWSYLAYCANQIRTEAKRRKYIRDWNRKGFAADYSELKPKQKVEAVVNGEIEPGRIVEGREGLGFALKGKRSYFPFNGQYELILIRPLNGKAAS